jgi:hypothetical protein
MWEVRAAPGRLDDLVAFAQQHADPSAQIFRADGTDGPDGSHGIDGSHGTDGTDGSHGTDPRVVVIDPSGRGLPDVPDELIARPPHAWPFTPVARTAPPG